MQTSKRDQEQRWMYVDGGIEVLEVETLHRQRRGVASATVCILIQRLDNDDDTRTRASLPP